MGLFTSKIALSVIAGGGITLGALGLTFGGTETLQKATSYVQDAGERLLQFKENEENLLNKFGALKADAGTKISNAKAEIKKLEGEKAALQTNVTSLQAEVDSLKIEISELKVSLQTEKDNHAATQAALDTKTNEYNTKVSELETANKKIADLNTAIKVAEEKMGEADVLVKQLEDEIKKANEEVDAHGKVVEQEKAETEDAEPITQEEIDALDTTVGDDDAEPAPENTETDTNK